MYALCGQQSREPKCHNPWHHKLVLVTWNITSLAEKEPEKVQKVEWYQLDIVGLISTNITGSETTHVECPGGDPIQRLYMSSKELHQFFVQQWKNLDVGCLGEQVDLHMSSALTCVLVMD